jgi:hypothetical protein
MTHGHGHVARIPDHIWEYLAVESARLNRKPSELLRTILSEWVTRRELRATVKRAA